MKIKVTTKDNSYKTYKAVDIEIRQHWVIIWIDKTKKAIYPRGSIQYLCVT